MIYCMVTSKRLYILLVERQSLRATPLTTLSHPVYWVKALAVAQTTEQDPRTFAGLTPILRVRI